MNPVQDPDRSLEAHRDQSPGKVPGQVLGLDPDAGVDGGVFIRVNTEQVDSALVDTRMQLFKAADECSPRYGNKFFWLGDRLLLSPGGVFLSLHALSSRGHPIGACCHPIEIHGSQAAGGPHLDSEEAPGKFPSQFCQPLFQQESSESRALMGPAICYARGASAWKMELGELTGELRSKKGECAMRIYEGNYAYEIEPVLDPATQVSSGWRYKVYRIRPLEELLRSGDAQTKEAAEELGRRALSEVLSSQPASREPAA